MHSSSGRQTAVERPWVDRVLILFLLAAAFGGWWWMMQRSLTNERDAVAGRLRLEAQERFERALNTVLAGLVRDRSEAYGVRTDPHQLADLIDRGLFSAFLWPEDGTFEVVEGKVPDAAAMESGAIQWGSSETGRDPVVSALLERLDEPLVREVLRDRLLGKSGPPMKASFRHRAIERFLEKESDPILADLGEAAAWEAAGELPPSGSLNSQAGVTLWWSERNLKERFEQAGVEVTLGQNGQRFTLWESGPRAELVPPELGDEAFSDSIGLVRWIGLGSGLLFAAAVVRALLLGWREGMVARLRTDLAASFAHELRTPLAGQRLLIESLLGGLHQNPEKQAEYLERVLRSNRRLGSLAEQFLTFSRLDRGVLRIERAETNIRELVDEILEGRERPFDECEVEVPEDLVASVDRGALGSILGNLVENAWKYSPDEKWIAIRVLRENGALRLEVEDRGVGFDAAQQRKAFKQFWRADTGLDRSVDGLGLGLTIVARLAEAHGGSVSLESEAGRGSTFRVILPETG